MRRMKGLGRRKARGAKRKRLPAKRRVITRRKIAGRLKKQHSEIVVNRAITTYGTRQVNPATVSLRRSAAAIVSVRNEEDQLGAVLTQLERLPLNEIIVIVNGSTDSSFDIARARPGVIVVNEPEAVGHDVGRALGTKLSSADILLFVDGDFPVSAELLVPFLLAVDAGADVALNDISPLLGAFGRWDNVTRVKKFLNYSLGRDDLEANSLTSVPHALSRHAVNQIGTETLMVPPKAQARAIVKKLKLVVCASIDVFSKNRHRVHNIGTDNPVGRLIIGDHIEALGDAMASGSPRLSFADLVRRRDMLGGGDGS
ncbi:glycosyltransferase [Paenibacillaceae bacterium]|nr:glycosyltransferase [Paenibacillaceae bacterium]